MIASNERGDAGTQRLPVMQGSPTMEEPLKAESNKLSYVIKPAVFSVHACKKKFASPPKICVTSNTFSKNASATTSIAVVPKLLKIFYMAVPYQKLFLPAVLWSRGGLKLSVVCNIFYVTSLNLLGNSETAKQGDLLSFLFFTSPIL